jgi:hypothetical protein
MFAALARFTIDRFAPITRNRSIEFCWLAGTERRSTSKHSEPFVDVFEEVAADSTQEEHFFPG